jgi:hypothetical protein
MRPVHAQLVSKLDTKTAKTADDVVKLDGGTEMTLAVATVPGGGTQ